MKWLLSALLALGFASPQVQPPVYRAGVYLVPYRVAVYPARNLTREDVRFAVGGQEFAPAEFEPDPKQRGAYLVYFAPPRDMRDGKSHELFIRVRNGTSWRDLGKGAFTLTLPVLNDDGQSAPPVFRGDTYAVPVHIALLQRKDRKDVPHTGLTRDDFILVLDRKEFDAIAAGESPDKPGHYAIYFQPPARYRDGKIHDVRLKVKRTDGTWNTLPTKWPTRLPTKPQ